MSKYLSEKQPKAFKAIIGDLREPSKLRDSMKKTFKIKSNFKKGNLFYEMLSNWNNCEQKFRDTKTPKEMKKLIKDHLIEKNRHFECPHKKCFSCKVKHQKTQINWFSNYVVPPPSFFFLSYHLCLLLYPHPGHVKPLGVLGSVQDWPSVLAVKTRSCGRQHRPRSQNVK